MQPKYYCPVRLLSLPDYELSLPIWAVIPSYLRHCSLMPAYIIIKVISVAGAYLAMVGSCNYILCQNKLNSISNDKQY